MGFINPYTFIPVNNGKKKKLTDHPKGDLTGKISCTLTAKTQLAVCDDSGRCYKGYDEIKEFNFFSVDGRPVIPGSSIRGVIRSVYEALTDSCLCSTNAEDKDYFTSRMKKDCVGLLECKGGKYYLYEKCERYTDKIGVLANYRSGDKVYYSSSDDPKAVIQSVTARATNYNKPAYVLKVEDFGNKRHWSIIAPRTGREPVEVDKVFVNRLKRNIEMYTTKKTFVKADYMAAYQKMQKGDGLLPVWYWKDNGNIYFAPSQISRGVYHNKPLDLLKKQNLDKCSDKDHICDACAVFGTVVEASKTKDNGGIALPAKLRFGDAECITEGNVLEGPFVLPILSSPRITSFEFYLKNTDGNNQYGADDKNVYIAGRKYYWHHNNNKSFHSDAVDLEYEKHRNQYSAVQLAKAGTKFRFDVYFENIDETTLRKLIFALVLGDNDEASTQLHKIGHGKPLGLGSVKITVDKVVARKLDGGKYAISDLTALVADCDGSEFARKNVQDILKVTSFNAVDGKLIDYPRPEGGKDIFKWFANNRDNMRDTGVPRHKQLLPSLNSASQELRANGGGYRGNGGGNRNSGNRNNGGNYHGGNYSGGNNHRNNGGNRNNGGRW